VQHGIAGSGQLDGSDQGEVSTREEASGGVGRWPAAQGPDEQGALGPGLSARSGGKASPWLDRARDGRRSLIAWPAGRHPLPEDRSDIRPLARPSADGN